MEENGPLKYKYFPSGEAARKSGPSPVFGFLASFAHSACSANAAPATAPSLPIRNTDVPSVNTTPFFFEALTIVRFPLRCPA